MRFCEQKRPILLWQKARHRVQCHRQVYNPKQRPYRHPKAHDDRCATLGRTLVMMTLIECRSHSRDVTGRLKRDRRRPNSSETIVPPRQRIVSSLPRRSLDGHCRISSNCALRSTRKLALNQATLLVLLVHNQSANLGPR